MGTLRHDARQCRDREQSERTRREIGLEYPAEKEARLRREEKARKEAQRQAQNGLPLGFGDDEL